MKTTFLFPTRGRVDSAKDAYTSVLDTAKRPDDVSFAVRIDHDDTSGGWPWNLRNQDFGIMGARQGCSFSYQELAKWVPGDLLMVMADDVRFRTLHWDDEFADIYGANAGKIFALYTNDLHTEMATHPGVPRAWLDEFKCLWPLPFEHFFSDTWIHMVARDAGVLRKTEAIGEHISPKYNGIPKDKTFEESRDSLKMAIDQSLYDNSAALRQSWVTRIKARETWA